MFRSKFFWFHILLMIITLMVIIFGFFKLLNVYTRHGEKIPIPDLKDLTIEKATTLSDENGFEIFVTDSLFIVGKPGGLILSQNPLKDDSAKKGRKIYVTVSKYSPDMVTIGSLPALYGKSFELKKKVLTDGYEIQSEIVGEKFDKGLPGMILKVISGQDTVIDENGIKSDYSIPRGATLKFIVSSKQGGSVDIPDLACFTLEEANFFISPNNLKLVVRSGQGGTYITGQEPAYSAGSRINRGDSIFVDLSTSRPEDCPTEEE